jgi:hypothetical protein
MKRHQVPIIRGFVSEFFLAKIHLQGHVTTNKDRKIFFGFPPIVKMGLMMTL